MDNQTTKPTTPTTYQWEESQLARVKFEVPSTWTNEAHGSNVLVVQDPKSGIGIEFVFIAPGTGGATLNEKLLLEELGKRVNDLKVSRPAKALEQHGMKGYGLGGTGSRMGKPVEWFTVAMGGKETGVVALGFAPAGQFHSHEEIMKRTMDSIQPNN